MHRFLVPGEAVDPLPKWFYGIYGSTWDPRTEEYPLALLSPISGFKTHSAHANNTHLRDEVYRHACWISIPDAKERGINDGDLVRVHSSVGESIVPAFVTARLTPGVAALFHGEWYAPSQVKTELQPDGIDRKGNPNLLIEDVLPDKMTIGPAIKTAPAEIERFDF
jgi:anaerobic dimethyl sulfoxide reductase subunit A